MSIAKTLVKKIAGAPEPLDFFALLSENGEKDNCILLESADKSAEVISQQGGKSIGCCNPSLRLIGKEDSFQIIALNDLGEKILQAMHDDFGFCESLEFSAGMISGIVKKRPMLVSEEERLKVPTLADVLRTIAFKFKMQGAKIPVPGGLFGAISYDFIGQFESLPPNSSDITNDPDFDMLFLDNLFIINHQANETLLVSNYFPSIEGESEGKHRSESILQVLEEALSKKQVLKANLEKTVLKKSSDTSKEEFIRMVEDCKEHIIEGDVFQIVVSKTSILEPVNHPLIVYKALKNLNPGPYMFYFKTVDGILFGSSPETFIKVSNLPLPSKERKVEIRPIAGTKPRGFTPDGKIDFDLDSRFENELKTDEKELAEHTMLVDLARNDVARVSKPGTRIVDKPHCIEKYSHVMHLVSNVSGILKPELDALHAYLASMNMGTLSGAPKVKAMELIRLLEKTKRGFYGGSIGYLTFDGELDSAIVIRSVRVKGNKAFVRSGAGIVFDSVPEKEFDEVERKARACVRAIEIGENAPGGDEK
ncbi:MAG: anthranilate synthase component 1 [Candidatus Diapherotrites archaeon]|nr:anthranilate synthase component 1 [Candidatus Diapherotrites archaeon]